MDTREEREAAARGHRALWSATMRQALDRNGLSVHAAARLSGVSPGALHAWLHSDLEPDPRALEPLAELLDVPHIRQLDLLGWLPADLRR